MIRSLLILFFTFCFLVPLSAQDNTFAISGQVTDSVTKLPLSNVNVQIIGTLRGTVTDSGGVFKLYSKEKEIILLFSLMGYERKYVKIKKEVNSQVEIYLQPKAETIKEVVISSSPTETILKSDRSHVIDYNFYGENILLITTGFNFSRPKLVLMNPSLDTLSIINIPEKPVRLFKDCMHNIHVVGEKKTYQVFYEASKLKLLAPFDLETFEAILFPCVAGDSLNLYFNEKYGSGNIKMERFNLKTNNHALRYYYINKSSREKQNLTTIVDQKTMELRAEEDKYLDDKEAAGMYRKPILKEFDRIFAETILYKEVYAPLFKLNDTIYIFNYLESKIQCYSPSGKLTKELGITFHEEENWKREMCIDEKYFSAYAFFESNGITEVKEINLNNGSVKYSFKVPVPFIENIKVDKGFVYFLYQGKEYTDTRSLSRIKL